MDKWLLFSHFAKHSDTIVFLLLAFKKKALLISSPVRTSINQCLLRSWIPYVDPVKSFSKNESTYLYTDDKIVNTLFHQTTIVLK